MAERSGRCAPFVSLTYRSLARLGSPATHTHTLPGQVISSLHSHARFRRTRRTLPLLSSLVAPPHPVLCQQYSAPAAAIHKRRAALDGPAAPA